MHISYVGIIFIVMLMIPNLIWTRYKPQDYDVTGENPFLRICERIGQAATTTLAIINFGSTTYRQPWFIFAIILMIIYELWWIRYFRSPRQMRDFYSAIFMIPLSGATAPVLAFLLLGISRRDPLLCGAVILLGIGHIGIHYQHYQHLKEQQP